MNSVDELCRRTEECRAGAIGKIEQTIAVGMERRSVVQHERRAGGERTDQPVPHHPTARREIEHAITGLDIAVQLMFLQMLQQCPAGAVDNAFRNAGRAGGIQDVKRLREWKLREGAGVIRMRLEPVVP